MFFSVHSDKYSVFTKDFKFVRYFSSIAFNWPQTLDELYTQNDVEMYRKAGDEMTNLAFDLTNTKANPWLASLVNNCSKKLNGLITREVGVDHGKETDAYPGGVASYAK